MSYFSKNPVSSKLLNNSDGGLRICQHGALLATLGHFTASREPAIISLPTGAGKTDLMFALAFALQAKRILIIEPSKFLRTQTTNRLRSLNLLREKGFLPRNHPHPNVVEVKTMLRTPEQWEELRDADAVVATPKTISPEENLVTIPPKDIFDVVFIDEAHHAAARNWRAIVQVFEQAHRILLTATAFRRDRRRLPGRLVYHYPIGRALDDKIYRPAKFLSVKKATPEKIDLAIASAASNKLMDEKIVNPDAMVLARTDRITNCKSLVAEYEARGLRAVEIHSGVKSLVVEERLKCVRNSQVDVVVTVGMMAEGIDIPNLKVAALHAPPRSLPYTLQLLGRVSRMREHQVGSAWLVTSPRMVRGEAQRLFREDRDWRQFIPDLVDDAIHSAHGDRTQIVLSHAQRSSLIPEFLQPFFSVRILRFEETNGRIHDERFPVDADIIPALPKTVQTVEALATPEDGCLAIITREEVAPKWGQALDLVDVRHDLHIFYAPPRTSLLFIATTAPVVTNALMGYAIDKTEPIDPRHLQGALSNAVSSGEYTAVGLQNALGLTGAHPSYRMHMGPGAGTSIRTTDGTVFGAGHVMGKMLNGEVRGLATANRRVWSMRRGSITDFLAWCRDIANNVRTNNPGLPGLTFLAEPVPAKELWVDRPLGVVVSERQFALPNDSLRSIGECPVKANTDPLLEVLDWDSNGVRVSMQFHTDSDPIILHYSPFGTSDGGAGRGNWLVKDARVFEVDDHRSNECLGLETFLNREPPIIIMPEGGAIRGDYGWKINNDNEPLPSDLAETVSWENTNIKKEVKAPREGLNVFRRTSKLLTQKLSAESLIVQDDGANEIADFVAVDPINVTIWFVHCKASSKDKPGNRVKDWYELFGQCARSHAWVRYSNLLWELDSRLDARKHTRMELGKRADLKKLATGYRPNQWHFKVVAVQPGCHIDTLYGQPDSKPHRGLKAVRDWLLQANADLFIWGS